MVCRPPPFACSRSKSKGKHEKGKRKKGKRPLFFREGGRRRPRIGEGGRVGDLVGGGGGAGSSVEDADRVCAKTFQNAMPQFMSMKCMSIFLQLYRVLSLAVFTWSRGSALAQCCEACNLLVAAIGIHVKRLQRSGLRFTRISGLLRFGARCFPRLTCWTQRTISHTRTLTYHTFQCFRGLLF